MSYVRAFALLALVFAAGAAAAQEGARVRVEVMVSQISDRAGSVDPRALELHRELQKRRIRYESLRVLQAKQLALLLDQIGSLELPNGRYVRLRPMHFQESGVLMAIQLEGGMSTDVHLREQLFIIGGTRYQDGELLISVKRLH